MTHMFVTYIQTDFHSHESILMKVSYTMMGFFLICKSCCRVLKFKSLCALSMVVTYYQEMSK